MYKFKGTVSNNLDSGICQTYIYSVWSPTDQLYELFLFRGKFPHLQNGDQDNFQDTACKDGKDKGRS